MILWNVFDAVTLSLLAICIFVWPTQLISDNQNRWLRFFAVSLIASQLVFDGPRVQLFPAYFVAGLFAILLIPRRSAAATPSRVRESKERFVKQFARWTAVIGTGFVLMISIVYCLFFPRYEYPRPLGKYSVGVRELRLTDSSRLETYTSNPNDHRELLLRISYPTEAGTTVRDLERDSVPDPAAVVARYALLFLWPGKSSAGLIPQSWGRVRTNAWTDVPPTTDRQRFPVLVYSHGLGSWPEQNTILVEELASQGYIVIEINHSGHSAGLKLSDGSTIGIEPILERGAISEKAVENAVENSAETQERSRALLAQLDDPSLSNDYRSRLIKERVALRPQATERDTATHRTASNDQRFVLSELTTLQANDAVLASHFDLDHIGVLGMSYGGTASHITCAEDRRCRAGVNLDGFQPLLLDEPPLSVPFMHMSNASHFNHAISYEQATAASYLVRIAGTAHGSFMDLPLTHPMIRQLNKLGLDVIGTIDGERMVRLVNEYVLAFFDKHLLGRDEPLMSRPSDRYPEVTFLSKEEK
ncbi:MAG: hypothetical protein ABIQ86_03695 [Steroidobacteraceae bacterium]